MYCHELLEEFCWCFENFTQFMRMGIFGLFQALESEIISHEPLIEAVANTAHHMVKNKHYASENITENLDDLQSQLQELKQLAADRRIKLQDAVESQTVCVLPEKLIICH